MKSVPHKPAVGEFIKAAEQACDRMEQFHVDKKALHVIEPDHGIGVVKFGESPDEVQEHLGLPDETEILDESTMFLRYSALKLSFAFRSVHCPSGAMSKRLVHFMSRHSKTTLWKKKIIGRPENEVLDIFREHGHGSFTAADEIMGSLSYRTFRFDQPHVLLDSSGGLIRGVLWGDNLGVQGW
jgi:hypothetical protein